MVQHVGELPAIADLLATPGLLGTPALREREGFHLAHRVSDPADSRGRDFDNPDLHDRDLDALASHDRRRLRCVQACELPIADRQDTARHTSQDSGPALATAAVGGIVITTGAAMGFSIPTAIPILIFRTPS